MFLLNKIERIQSNFVVLRSYLPSWLILWYFLGCLYVFISGLQSVTIWSIPEPIINEGDFLITHSQEFHSGSIGNLILLSALWPIIVGVLFTFGLLLGGEIVGYEYSSNLPLLIILYYIKAIQSCLPLSLIGLISGFIVFLKSRIRSYLY